MGIYILLFAAVAGVYYLVASGLGMVAASWCGSGCLLGGSLPLTLGVVAVAALVVNRVVLLLPATRITRVAYHVVTVVFYVAVVALINAVMPL